MGSREEESGSSSSSSWVSSSAPLVSPLSNFEREHWRHFDNSVNAVSFGFVATAILISMFLVMAIFERFLRSRPSSLSSSSPSSAAAAAADNNARNTTTTDLEAPVIFHSKLTYPSPKMTVYAKGVSVLMPGDHIPTFIAHPAPVPCPPEPTLKPSHQHYPCLNFSLPSTSS